MSTQNPYAIPLWQLKQQMEAEAAAPSVHPEVRKANEEWARFQQMCPDFSGTLRDAEALVRHLPNNIGLFPRAEQLRNAHVQAWYRGEYAPVETQQDSNPATMPLHELRRQVMGEEPPPPLYSQDMSTLRDDALGIVREEQDPAWKAPMGELKTALENTNVDTGGEQQ